MKINSLNSLVNTFIRINAIDSKMPSVDEFIVGDVNEDPQTQNLNGGITKKFTSLATNATLFRWRFGDTNQNPIVETTENPYYHTFNEAGTYIINHQSCIPCGNALICSNGWCTQTISITPPHKDLTGLTLAGLFGFVIFSKKGECEDYKFKDECDKKYCTWLEKENRCVKKCEEGYKIEKIRTDETKRSHKFICRPKPIKKT